MALAIASGTTPDKGISTAIIAGFLISALGGSRVQIGGPTAAFIPVVFVVIERFGYGGLILCTLMAGLMLIAAGLLRLGTLMRYMPQPVITGFTAGIAVTIFSSQVTDALGLQISDLPGDFIGRWTAYAQHVATTQPVAIALTVLGLAVILALRRWRPNWPAFLIALLACTGVALAVGLPAETIGSRFGALPNTLPEFQFPTIPFERTLELLPSAFTIAFLAGVESLLSAVVADGMMGGRHRSNGELVAQGVANVGSALFGGLPATGAIARTATNIRAGARSPMSGMLHAVFLLLFMVLLAPLASWVPLAALAAILVIVAWNMSESGKVWHLLQRAPVGDRVVMVLTFLLTVLVDLTVAIQVGVVLAAILFMHRMAGLVAVNKSNGLIEEDLDDFRRAPEAYDQRDVLLPGVEVFRLSGPLFFGAAARVRYLLDTVGAPPRVFILRMRDVPMIDASGAQALDDLVQQCQKHGTKVILTGVQPEVSEVLERMDLGPTNSRLLYARNYDHAIALAAN